MKYLERKNVSIELKEETVDEVFVDLDNHSRELFLAISRYEATEEANFQDGQQLLTQLSEENLKLLSSIGRNAKRFDELCEEMTELMSIIEGQNKFRKKLTDQRSKLEGNIVMRSSE